MKQFEQQYLGKFVMPKKVLVVAGNKREFDYFCREHRDSETKFVYISDERKLRGIRDAEVVFYGTYYERRDIHVIEEMVRVRRLSGDLR